MGKKKTRASYLDSLLLSGQREFRFVQEKHFAIKLLLDRTEATHLAGLDKSGSDNLQICYKINAPGYNTVCRWRQTHSFILSVNNREQHGTHAQLAIGNGYQNNVTWLRLFYGMTFFSAQRIKIQHRQIYDIDSLAYLIQRASP